MVVNNMDNKLINLLVFSNSIASRTKGAKRPLPELREYHEACHRGG
jgi:hypothetical protein